MTKAYQGAQFLVCGHTVSTQMKANKELKHSNKKSKLAKKKMRKEEFASNLTKRKGNKT